MPRYDDHIPDRHTDFSKHSHSELVNMLYASDPRSVTAAAEVWSGVGTSLHERSVDLLAELSSFQDKWTGGAAEQYKLMIKDLAAGIERVANTALEIRDLTYVAADALQHARDKMPAAVSVPAISATTLAIATTPLPAVAPPGETLAAMAARQAMARAEVTQQQQAQAAATAAQDQAVQIMNELAGTYLTAKSAMPTTPESAAPPTIGTDTDGSTVVVTSTGITYHTNPALTTVTVTPSTTPPPASPPLFGQMFSAGLAAAAAALGGRFGKAVSGLVHNGTDTKPVPAPDTTKLTSGSGGGGGGGGGGVSAPAAAASPLLSAGTAAAIGTGIGLAGAAGATGGMMGGFMPAMPMGGMMGGADGMNGGRRIPPWLVETEDVWGESTAVTPSVIGESDAA